MPGVLVGLLLTAALGYTFSWLAYKVGATRSPPWPHRA